MRKHIPWLLSLLLLIWPAIGMGEDSSRVLYFPFLTQETADAEPQYVIEFITMQTHPLTGELIADAFYAYPYDGEADLGLYYDNGFVAHAYHAQLEAEDLYGYHISLSGLPRDDVIVVKTFESGIQWPETALGSIREANLVAGGRFYLMLEILQDGGFLPYSRTEIDCSALALGESLSIAAAFDEEAYREDAFTITVTKELWLRRPMGAPAGEEAPNPAAILDIVAALSETQARPTQEPVAIEEPDVPLAGPTLSLTTPPVTLRVPSAPESIGWVEVTNENNVNVRALPDPESERVTVLSPGAIVDCVGIAGNGWYELLLPGGEQGYVSPKMVSFVAK